MKKGLSAFPHDAKDVVADLNPQPRKLQLHFSRHLDQEKYANGKIDLLEQS